MISYKLLEKTEQYYLLIAMQRSLPPHVTFLQTTSCRDHATNHAAKQENTGSDKTRRANTSEAHLGESAAGPEREIRRLPQQFHGEATYPLLPIFPGRDLFDVPGLLQVALVHLRRLAQRQTTNDHSIDHSGSSANTGRQRQGLGKLTFCTP